MSKDTVEKIGQVMEGAGSHVVGAIVFWSLYNVRVSRETWRGRWTELGLDKALGRDPTLHACLTRAVQRSVVRVDGLPEGVRGIFHRRLPSGAGWGVVAERNGGADDLEHVHALSCKVHADQVAVKTLDGDVLPRGFEAKLMAELAEARDYVHTDEAGQHLVEALGGVIHAVGLRGTTGGVYFVPAGSVDTVQQLRNFIETVAPESRVRVLTITGSAGNLEQAAEVAASSFRNQLGELQREVAAFAEERRNAGKDQASDYSVRVRADRYRDLAGRVDAFSGVLGDITQELKRSIKEAQASLRADLGLE